MYGDTRATQRAGIWNVARGTALAVLTSGPPLLAARYLPRAEFTPWIVGFSILPWLAISQAGLQPGVLALLGDDYRREVRAAATIGKAAFRTSLLQYTVVCIGAAALFGMLSAIDLLPSSLGEVLARPLIAGSLLFVGLFQVLSSVGNAYMVGINRSKSVALLTAGGASIFLAAAASWIHVRDGSVSGVSLSLMIVVGLIGPTLGSLYHARESSGPIGARPTINVPTQLRQFMLAQAVWVVPGVVVTGMDNLLVAQFDPAVLRVYSVAIALVGLATAAIGALSAPYISLLASLARVELPAGDETIWGELSRPLISLSRTAVVGSSAIAALGFLPLSRMTSSTLSLEIAQAGFAVPVLAVGIGVRLLTVPLATLVVALRRQSTLYPSAIGEAAANAVLSVTLGVRYGALGVALGTLIGAFVAVGAHGYAAYAPLSSMGGGFRRWWAYTVAVPAMSMLLIVVLWVTLSGRAEVQW